MDRCPELIDLEGFFKSSAHAAYGHEDVGWYYDSLAFKHQAEDERILCTVEPAGNRFSIIRTLESRVDLDLSFQYVVSLELEHSAGIPLLVGRISRNGVEQLFKLTLAPFSFRLGTQLPSY